MTTATYDEVLVSVGLKPSTKRTGCGSHAGYVAHTSAGEEACEPCKEANRVYKRERHHAPKQIAVMPPIEHNTARGARQHWYRGQTPCDGCRLAYNAEQAPRQRVYWRQRRLAGTAGGR